MLTALLIAAAVGIAVYGILWAAASIAHWLSGVRGRDA